MRVEPFGVDSYVHAIKRGGRGSEIVRDEEDRWRFIKTLFYLNDEYRSDNWEDDLFRQKIPLFERPSLWPDRKPLVKILVYILMPNHFHLILKEIKEGGISTFMRGVCGSMTMSFNRKYKGKGSIFQGSYKGMTIETDEYMRRLAIYIMVKNSFELYPGGMEIAMQNFDKAFSWSLQYQFSSLADYASDRQSPIIDKDVLGDIFRNNNEFKTFAKDTMFSRGITEKNYEG
ncbi:MAG: hypothetical protein A2836_01025 [Candidatus Taylorbacteria bacterium RIFCSPHIGHO2_01_FULL_45_63]|uniref:Transposase IS200-like domain-containing protein n=1 Tax=Candidatus Taylorbacteria bacterium RIFCSPHIGHO2_02_FULL_45_35 TaxID=1802311 RepID=A0A1G2MRN6_9BACT|nr:MAG: hypothetical protein A2836_01025 [Candidatus Taylorbacteria bacterium RIFCSPHIGHO2_01_FULL_45_63]OHA25879.1 MAG: hypothetical protein A3D56_01795 [Candidatus Taylorbacteria bacterium RIFCSPHIGHO2_02_FULL_45_35]OHA32369.1 MAG: hypothetical protein A3A22_03625 [Candidatus Taylorbacteria bacterium RIFCSPLOWO2_01_FULL_45_34b]